MGNIFWIALVIWLFWSDIKPIIKEVTIELNKAEKRLEGNLEPPTSLDSFLSDVQIKVINNSEPDVEESKFNADGSVNWNYIDKQEKKKWN